LTGVVEILFEQYQHGSAEFRTLALAQTDLLAAEFDATDDANERIVLLERELKVATDALDTAERKVQAGRANAVESLQAKALVLDIKIKLLRERSKAKLVAK
jgi:outer membrane protein TolC